jgi:hypothetical protein
MKRIEILLIGLFLPSLVAAGCAPEKMVRVVVRDATPGLDPTSFGAKPKTLYRLGNRYGRMEELPDPAQGSQGLMIANEPDLWMINLATRHGLHALDGAKSKDFQAPVLAAPDASEFVKSFELGCERAYMKERSVAPRAVQAEGRKLDTYQVSEGKETIVLSFDGRLQRPVTAELRENGKVVRLLKYVEYDSGLAPDMKLFEKPSDIEFAEKTP